jgi:hypothetical protein
MYIFQHFSTFYTTYRMISFISTRYIKQVYSSVITLLIRHFVTLNAHISSQLLFLFSRPVGLQKTSFFLYFSSKILRGGNIMERVKDLNRTLFYYQYLLPPLKGVPARQPKDIYLIILPALCIYIYLFRPFTYSKPKNNGF